MKHLTDKLRLLAALRFGSSFAVVALLFIALPAKAAPGDLIGDPAPDFALRSVAHGNIRFSEYRSQIVVLTFRSDWCGRCNTLLPLLNDMQALHGSDDIQILAVDVDGDPEQALDLLEEQAINFPLLLDTRQQVSRNYDLNRLPVTLVIDRAGTVRSVYQGAKSEARQQLQADVASLMAE